MLAQAFKSAADLDLTDDIYSALLKTLALMETGKLRHVSHPEYRDRVGKNFTGHFNMNIWNRESACGTVGCIGGMAEMIGGLETLSIGTASRTNSALRALLFPHEIDDLPKSDWAEITVEQAALALRSYLTTGRPEWANAIAG